MPGALYLVIFLQFVLLFFLTVLFIRKIRKISGRLSSRVGSLSERLEEEARRAGEEKNRILAVLESLREGVAVIDKDEKTLLLNKALIEALGLPRADVESKSYWEIFRDAELNEMLGQALETRGVVRREHSILLSERVFQIQISPVLTDGEFLGAAAVFYDVTRLKNLERMRSEFVANVSHELKTPLTSILGFIETLKGGAVDDAENRMKFLSIIEGHAKKLSALIEDLLSLSKIESSEEPLALERVDFEKMADEALLLFEKAAREKNLKITKEISPRPFFLQAEPKSFRQVLNNLLDNAVKYNVHEGSITIRAHEDASTMRIEVTDTGIGIGESDLPRVFERFYRSEKSRSRESGGTGLGLSIAKHIVERHGGMIQAESAREKGSVFTVILPKPA